MSRAHASGLLLALAVGAVAAEPGPDDPAGPSEGPPSPGQACHQVAPGLDSWLDREDVIQRHAQLPAACLKTLVRECSAAAHEGLLDGGQAITCSIRYEALLRHGFRGDFQALMAWWRSERAAR